MQMDNWMTANCAVKDTVREVVREAFRTRDALEPLWGPDTAHPSCAGVIGPRSLGQCYVSSMAMVERLNGMVEVESVVICRGHVLNGTGVVLIEDHSWVVVGLVSSEDSLLIDLTLDQVGTFPPVITSFSPVFKRLEYKAQESRLLTQVTNESVWLRYMVLDVRLSDARRSHA